MAGGKCLPGSRNIFSVYTFASGAERQHITARLLRTNRAAINKVAATKCQRLFSVSSHFLAEPLCLRTRAHRRDHSSPGAVFFHRGVSDEWHVNSADHRRFHGRRRPAKMDEPAAGAITVVKHNDAQLRFSTFDKSVIRRLAGFFESETFRARLRGSVY